jgi:lipoprotein-anchoring transpeptidase ErfK/SrfK
MVTSDLEPAVKEDGTTEARSQAEKFMRAAPISVTFEANTWQADRAEIGSWIKFNVSGHKLVAVADSSGFTNWLAKQVEIPAKDKEIEDGTGTVLNEGQDGRGADTNTLKNQIKDALFSGTANASFALATFAIPRGQTTIYPHAEPGRYPGRYIDINLSEQTLYAFEGNTQVNSFLVSTGKSGYRTPTGEFHIYSKNRYTLMHGPDYYLPNVPFVSWFYADYSIHGTYWHHNFGHVMSHGCVNMETDAAEWIYNWDDIGTPVYIHY